VLQLVTFIMTTCSQVRLKSHVCNKIKLCTPFLSYTYFIR
jgi:hypothetical protein